MADAVLALRLGHDPILSLTIAVVGVVGYLIWHFIRKPWRDQGER